MKSTLAAVAVAALLLSACNDDHADTAPPTTATTQAFPASQLTVQYDRVRDTQSQIKAAAKDVDTSEAANAKYSALVVECASQVTAYNALAAGFSKNQFSDAGLPVTLDAETACDAEDGFVPPTPITTGDNP